MSKTLKLNDPQTISMLQDEINGVEQNYPLFMAFLEQYCGFYFPVLSSDPNEIVYSSGKRDVILTIKSISRKDVDAKTIAAMFERNSK